MTSKQLKL